MMSREEHLQWCKERAMEYVKDGDLQNAVASMLSDLNKHPQTMNYPAVLLSLGMLVSTNREEVTRFILGFN